MGTDKRKSYPKENCPTIVGTAEVDWLSSAKY